MSEGAAKIVGESAVTMVTDGPCLTGTLEQLETGVGAKPMPRSALAKVRVDALALLGKVLEAYAVTAVWPEFLDGWRRDLLHARLTDLLPG